jgi:four helix bundle protein
MTSPIHNFRDLTAWQRSVELFVAVTRIVRGLPWPDRLVFETQSRRAARSVASNISEGHKRRHLGDYLRHLSYARGSIGEIETDLVLIERTTAAPKIEIASCEAMADEISRMLSTMSTKLRRRQ